MTQVWSWSLPESHLLPDAIVALVDGELSAGAQGRAMTHIAGCADCAADVAAQREARCQIQFAKAPGMSAGFLASLRSIPHSADLAGSPGASSSEKADLSGKAAPGSFLPDNLAVTEDGQVVLIQRAERVAEIKTALASHSSDSVPSGSIWGTPALGSSPRLGSSPPLGSGALGVKLRDSASTGAHPLDPNSPAAHLSDAHLSGLLEPPQDGADKRHYRKRVVQGAGVVVSGLVLGALAFTATSGGGVGARGVVEDPPTANNPQVLRAQFGVSDREDTSSPVTSSPTSSLATPSPAGSFKEIAGETTASDKTSSVATK
jgi:hypothetical protein